MANLSQQFYNLDTDPFRLSPDHHFSFPHGTYKKGLADLKLALLGKAGLIAITGRPGTGKTTLLNEAIAQLDANTFVVATLITTRFEAHELWSMVASSFGQDCNNKSSSGIPLELENFFRMKHSEGKRVLLVVDEAQGLGDDVLDELQLLSKLQDDGKPLLQVILIGPEEFENALNSPEQDDSDKRAISASQLDPLSESETIDYITHRLNHAGWKGDPAISKGAGCLVHHFSRGNPRVINRICSRFLLYGCAEKKHELNADDMKLVLEELSDEQLISKNIVVPFDVAERVKILEYEYIQPLRKIKKTSIQTLFSEDNPVSQPDTEHQQAINADRHIDDLSSSQDLDAANEPSGPTEHPEVSNKQASTVETDESSDNASVESAAESQTPAEAAADNSPASQALDDGKGSRWPDKPFWMAVLLAIAIVVGLKFYFEAPQDPAPVQPQAGTDSRSPAPQIQLAENTRHTDLPAENPGTAPSTNQTSTVEAAEPLKPQQTELDEVATEATPAPKEITPEAAPDRTDKTAPPVITRPAGPTGQEQPAKTTAAPDIPAEPIKPLLPATSEEPVSPGNAEASATDRSDAEPVKQASRVPAWPTPEVKETTGTPAVAKKDPVIIKPETSSRPVKKKPEKVRVTRNTTKTAHPASMTMDNLLARQWISGARQQAAHLPSFTTSCSSTSRGGECWSGEYTTEISGKPVSVKTKSYLKGFTKSGFTIRYKNMLLGGPNEKRRWEDKIHQLDCKFISRNKIKCSEAGANRTITFTQNTSN